MAKFEFLLRSGSRGLNNNKALEIYNGTGAAIDLAAQGYVVQMYFDDTRYHCRSKYQLDWRRT